ncbi:MAG TPA: hypothetical protein VK166_17160 [Chitinophagaceae bacterium]|nr:hypothetical protein [Chitinophagaceae bacterium]
MKKTIVSIAVILMSTTLLFAQGNLQGAWQAKTDQGIITMTIVDNYMVAAFYNMATKEFYATHGARLTSVSPNKIKWVNEFNSAVKDDVGKVFEVDYKIEGNQFSLTNSDTTMVFERVDDGTKNLAGNWRITQREQNGQLTPIHTSGPRKTIKILSSTRFQWAAINTETGEFFGTGGGTYTFKDGIYTENIEFFSRDSSRVGMSLSFNGKLDKNDWYHSGKSSKGDPINEVWSRK